MGVKLTIETDETKKILEGSSAMFGVSTEEGWTVGVVGKHSLMDLYTGKMAVDRGVDEVIGMNFRKSANADKVSSSALDFINTLAEIIKEVNKNED